MLISFSGMCCYKTDIKINRQNKIFMFCVILIGIIYSWWIFLKMKLCFLHHFPLKKSNIQYFFESSRILFFNKTYLIHNCQLLCYDIFASIFVAYLLRYNANLYISRCSLQNRFAVHFGTLIIIAFEHFDSVKTFDLYCNFYNGFFSVFLRFYSCILSMCRRWLCRNVFS